MATWTKATLATRTLEHMGLIGEGQSASSEQQNRTEDLIDSIYPQLRKIGLAPFPTTAIPEYAQQPLIKIIAGDLAFRYGFSGQRLIEWVQGKEEGRRELQRQLAPDPLHLPIRTRYM